MRAAIDFVGAGRAGHRHAAQHLVHHAHVAADVPEIRDFPTIEVSEVDAGGEDLAALVLRVLDHAAAQHADLAQRIENGDISRGLGVGERVVVLGIKEARIFDGDDGGFALALDFGRAKIDYAFRDEFAHALQGLRLRPQHSLTEMHACVGYGEHVRQENSLIDLDAVFLALHQRVFGLDLPLRRRETGHELSRFVDQFVDAQEFFVSVGQFAIDAARVRGHEALTRIAALQKNDIRRALLLRRSQRSLRQLGQKICPRPPEAHARSAIAFEFVAKLRLGIEPQDHAAMRQAGMFQNDARVVVYHGLCAG